MAQVTDQLNQYLNRAKELRAQLDSGQIDFPTYIQQADALRQESAQFEMQLGGTGSGGATLATQYQNALQQATGLAQDFTQPGVLKYKPVGQLSKQYQQQIRESLLPANLSPEEKQAFLADIPNDIEYGSDRYALEREGIRQKLQAKKTAGEAATKRTAMLGDLSKTLADYQAGEFSASIPQIAEDANTAGIYRSTGYGEALARKATDLTRQSSDILRMKALEDRDMDINAISEADRIGRDFQTSALSRDFSLGDAATDYRRALDLAEATKVKAPGKSNTQKWSEGIQTGSSVVQAGRTGK